MPLLQYFGWVGGFLLAALLAASWCISAPIALAPRSDVPLDQKINIRIHTDQKWPEHVVFDTTHLRLAPESTADSETNNGRSETIAQVERQPFDAFAEIPVVHVGPCFRPPCSSGQDAERDALRRKGAPDSHRSRSSSAAHKRLIFPSPLHTPPGRS
jgi:hypothetical protein